MIGKKFKDLNLRYLRYRYPLDKYPSCFDDHKCIFFHIPKAAGTSVCFSMFGYQVGHLNFNKLYYSNPRKASEYYKFTFVRNPWARLVSAYHFLLKGGMNSTDKNWAKINLIEFSSFGDFVRSWVNDENINSYIHFIPQYKFISDGNGVIKADFVGKTENIETDFPIVIAKLGMDSALLHLNETKNNSDSKSYMDLYDEETKGIVASVYARDIELFGYKFGK